MVVPEQSINNIMGGLESTGGVTLHNHRRKLKQRFDIVKKLGQGTYGKVQLGMNKETNQAVAIKTIKKCKIQTDADLIRIRREIQIMSSLRHPYIIHIYEVFENKDKMVLVMEYAAGGELYDYLNTQKALDEGEARRIFRQIAMAVFYCHKYQICHRDLKLENILLDENGNAKIADFGLSNVFDKGRLLSTFCGSPLYASPEIVRGIPYIGPEVDCWSLGVLLYTLVYRAMPFDGSNFKRLVMQISIGAYFEPKDDKSSASGLIRSLLTVNPSTRLTIADVCKHPWMNQEGKVSCYRLAEELALEPPNRLDLLLALATPPQTEVAPVPEEPSLAPNQESAPPRSMSLGNLSTVQHSATYTAVPTAASQPQEPAEEKIQPEVEKKSSEEKERRRDRSRSKSRRKEVATDETKKKSSRTKKKSAEEIPSKEELTELLGDALKISSELEVKETEKAPTEGSGEATSSIEEVVEKDKKESIEPKQELVEAAQETTKTEEDEMKTKEIEPAVAIVPEEKIDRKVKESPSISRIASENVRRKSEAFEQGELQAPTESPKKKDINIARRGVSVSDARAAFERRSSADVRKSPTKRVSPQPIKKPEFSLASAVNVTDIVKAELGNEADVIIAPSVEDRAEVSTEEPVKKEDEVKMKKENAVKVISHAISESEMNEKKASTLPRRRLSRPTVSQPCSAEPQRVASNTKVSQFVFPSVPPVPAPRPSLIKQESAPCPPKERIIPILVEKRASETTVKDKPQQVSRQGSASSSARSSTSSLGRQDSTSSTLSASTTTTTATAEPIRKSPREVIIPIAVEGGGIVTPSERTLSKMSLSVSEDEDTASLPLRSFGLHSTRPRQLDSADSVSSDEDDDNFEMLSTENLFSTLLTRMRHLTQNLDHGRPTFPKLFHHPLFEPRRLTETKSFTSDHADPTPWRRKSSNNVASSSATLPRGFSTKAFRRLPTRDDLPPPAASMSTSRRINRTVSDSTQNGFDSAPLFDNPTTAAVNHSASTSGNVFSHLSSLDRVKRYLEDINRSEFRRPCRSVYVPGMSQTSEFEKFRQAARCNGAGSFSGQTTLSRGPSLNAYDKIKELREYHNNRKSMMEDKSHESESPPKKEETKSVLEKYLYGEHKPKKTSRFLNKSEGSKKKEESRVDKTIKALRRNSIGIENAFSESKLLKRAVSLEDISTESKPNTNGNNRNKRASSLKPEEASPPFEKKDTVAQRKKGGVFDAINSAKEKLKLDLPSVQPQLSYNSTESTPTGDVDDTQSFVSNSDTWSSSDPTERFFDAAEDCVSERIRRKSFYLRFNLPKRNGSFHRSTSNSERKRYF